MKVIFRKDKKTRCLLNKSLYVLKQSPKQWYKWFDSFIIKVRYNRCEYDSCVYFKQNDDPTYLLSYVDDVMIATRNKTQIQKLKAQLKKEFDINDLREAKKILGVEITKDRGSIRLWLSQENYILKVLERFNMAEARSATTLMPCHFKLSSKQYPQSLMEKEMSRVLYTSVVRGIAWLAQLKR